MRTQQRHMSWADVGKSQAMQPRLIIANNAAILDIAMNLKIANAFQKDINLCHHTEDMVFDHEIMYKNLIAENFPQIGD